MKNKMKQKHTFDEIEDIFSFNQLGHILELKQLNGGEFNSVYKVKTDLDVFVIKIAPSEALKVLTYEKNIIESERFALEQLSHVKSVKIPRVIAYGCSQKKYNYLIIEFVDGKMLSDIKLNSKNYDDVMFSLGKAVAEFHNISCNCGFGYIQNGLKSTWRAAYYDMVNQIVRDAERVNCKIPYLSEALHMIDKAGFVFDEVKKPSVLHFDLWHGNIFVKDNQLSAVIDFERTILGDPLGDFIHLNYLPPFDINKNKPLIDGYNSVANHKLSFNKNEMIRLYLMRVYLGLVACVEPYYRFSKCNVMFYYRRSFAKRFMRVTLYELDKLMKG